MPKIIEAIYEEGVIKPLKPLSLPSKKLVLYIEERRFSDLVDELELEAREDVEEGIKAIRRGDHESGS
ncbi:hypothetical protein A3L09_09205 [Thermococcus profundus]|uniref:Antitoxin n=1 Tax=Thermococcus profundus TaxID=49899 RepID=A0A2Z2MHL1_THEPR|nr:antitoxin family protein [Thermococcus profundus]ASJ03424.1 hypothetical protein A3L09_09205 [Thermococcus profundus]